MVAAIEESEHLRTEGTNSQAVRSIILLGAGFTTRNLGVWALASGAIGSALHCFPNAAVCLVDYHQTPEVYSVRHTGGAIQVELLNIRFSKRMLLRNNIARLLLAAIWYRLLPSTTLKKQFASRNPVLTRLLEADVTGSIAGGDSFSDIYGLPRLLYVGLPQVLVLMLGRPRVLLPQTLGPV